MGTVGTVGIEENCDETGTVCTHTHCRCGVDRYRYGLDFANPYHTCVEP